MKNMEAEGAVIGSALKKNRKMIPRDRNEKTKFPYEEDFLR